MDFDKGKTKAKTTKAQKKSEKANTVEELSSSDLEDMYREAKHVGLSYSF